MTERRRLLASIAAVLIAVALAVGMTAVSAPVGNVAAQQNNSSGGGGAAEDDGKSVQERIDDAKDEILNEVGGLIDGATDEIQKWTIGLIRDNVIIPIVGLFISLAELFVGAILEVTLGGNRAAGIDDGSFPGLLEIPILTLEPLSEVGTEVGFVILATIARVHESLYGAAASLGAAGPAVYLLIGGVEFGVLIGLLSGIASIIPFNGLVREPIVDPVRSFISSIRE